LRAAVKDLPVAMNIIPLDYKIEGSSKETARFYALRMTYYTSGGYIAVYSVHLVAESHISDSPVDGGYSLSQMLRQTQFEQLIADAEKFDGAIIVGDFNAQIGEEYSIFTENGYSLVNDGSIGTLRGTLCADNIIVSEGMKIENYKVLNGYTLNTDHFGLLADITIG
jgi:hypothetical protein